MAHHHADLLAVPHHSLLDQANAARRSHRHIESQHIPAHHPSFCPRCHSQFNKPCALSTLLFASTNLSTAGSSTSATNGLRRPACWMRSPTSFWRSMVELSAKSASSTWCLCSSCLPFGRAMLFFLEMFDPLGQCPLAL